MAAQDVEVIAAALYVMDPARFVAARTEAVQQAREAGDRDLATALARLRRPTVSAWAVNLLVRSAAAEVTELLSLGVALRVAQQQLQGEQLRELTQRRRELLGVLCALARRLAADAGHPLSGAAPVEVEQTLAAALADPDSAEAVRTGLLTRPLQHVGFGAEPVVAAPPRAQPSDGRDGAPTPPTPSVTPASTAPAVSPGQEMVRRPHRQERLVRDLAQARQELAEAITRVERAEHEAGQAAERSADVQRRLVDLQRERDQAQRDSAAAQRRTLAAARVRDEAQQRVQRLTDAQKAAR